MIEDEIRRYATAVAGPPAHPEPDSTFPTDANRHHPLALALAGFVLLAVVAILVLRGGHADSDPPTATTPPIDRIEDLPGKVAVPGPDGQIVGYVDTDALMAFPTDPPGEPLRSIYGDNPGYLVRDLGGNLIGFLRPRDGFISLEDATRLGITGAPPPAQ